MIKNEKVDEKNVSNSKVSIFQVCIWNESVLHYTSVVFSSLRDRRVWNRRLCLLQKRSKRAAKLRNLRKQRERETGACSEEKGKLGSLISEYEATSNDHRGNIPYTVERRRGATERILFNRRPWRGNRHEFWSVSDSSTVPPKYLMKHSGRNMGPRIPPETAWSPWPASPARPPLLWYITSLLTRPALSIYW